jgi:subtilisin-like proprotein convertase family protein
MQRRFSIVAAGLAVLAGLAIVHPAAAQDLGRSKDGSWTIMADMPEAASRAEAWIRPELDFVPARLDVAALTQLLVQAPMEGSPEAARGKLVLELPTPEGGFAAFEVVESPIMEPELAAKFPEIKTYLGQGLDDPAATLRFTVAPAGFDAQVLSPNGAYYIDRYSRGDSENYAVYNRADYRKEVPPFNCLTVDDGQGPVVGGGGEHMVLRAGSQVRTYRTAINTTGEFTAFHGGTVAGGLAAVTTIMNRVNGIYENDFSSRLILVANQNLLIYTNAATDPFTTPGANSTTNTQSTSNINTVIGAANYDVGHVFHRAANNGLAGAIGNVCSATKGGGTSCTEPPTGDLFAVDYVAHEMGHQFGMRHNFNSCSGSQGDSSTLANEPGSGTTIMGYAGICGATNIQLNSDPYFNNINFDQFLTYQAGTGGCPTPVATGNNVPTVNAGLDYTIPKQTPFTLTASGSDADGGDVLTYCWEVREGGSAITPGTDNGSSPIMRSRLATVSPSRTIPRLSNLLANTFDTGEYLYQVARTQTWRCTVRDNRAGNGGVNTDDMILTVSNAGPFQVTAPNTNVTWAGFQTVTWNVNGTNAAPVNTANVRILLSTDGGLTFPTVLAASTPNDGSEGVLLPNINSNTARVRVEAIGNIYFDVSNTNFTVTFTPPGTDVQGSGVNSFSDATPTGNNNGVLEPGEGSIAVNVGVVNVGATTATGVTGTLVSLTPTVTVTQANSAYPNLPLGASSANSTPYVIAIDASHPCGAPISLRLDISSNEDAGTANVTFATGTPFSANFSVPYSGAPVFIPDNNPTGATATVTVSGVGTLTDVNFRFDGSSCSNVIGATTVGLDHTFIGDIVISLTSPAGTSVTLINRRGGGGNNICNLLFDDDGGFPNISTLVTGAGPYGGSFAPESPLSAFDGQNADGVWSLKVVDAANVDTGNIRAFTLLFTGVGGTTCEPPLAPVSCFGDADGDLDRDFADITAILANFGLTPGAYGPGDADGNGVVEFADITAVLANFGIPCS